MEDTDLVQKAFLTQSLCRNRNACSVLVELLDKIAEEPSKNEATHMDRIQGVSYLLDLVGESIREAYLVLIGEKPAR